MTRRRKSEMSPLIVVVAALTMTLMTSLAEARPKPGAVVDDSFAHKYLEQYGYAKKQKDVPGSPAALLNFKGSILEMQRFLGIPQTGELDAETLRVMRMTRCGNPDKDDDTSSLSGRSKRYLRMGQKWHKDTVTYTIKNWTSKLGRLKTNEAIERAFRVWSKHIPIEFKSVRLTDRPDMEIFFASGSHGDNTAFDGKGGFLAHAFYPGRDIGGDTHFDNEEPWVYEAKKHDDGNDLFLVAVHELGHALGLGHSSRPEAIMAPVYKYHNLTNFDISQDDIDGIQEIYGIKRARPMTKPTTSTTTTTTRRSKYPKPKPPSTTTRWRNMKTTTPTTTTEPPRPKLCQLRRYDAVTFIRGELYVFSGKWLWRRRMGQDRFTGPILISKMWRDVGHVTAVYEDSEADIIRFFDGYMYSEYRAATLLKEKSHVRTLGLQNDDVQAAMWWSDKDKTYLFRDNWLWRLSKGKDRYDKYKPKVDSGYPRPFSHDLFSKVPQKFDTAFTDADDQGRANTYFVRGTKFYQYRNDDIDKLVHAGSFKNEWLKCDVYGETDDRAGRPDDDDDDADGPSTAAATESGSLAAIIAVVVIASSILISVIAYAWFQRKNRHHHGVKSSVLVNGAANGRPPPYCQGWNSASYNDVSGTHHGDDDGATKTMCVTAAQQRWRLMRFNFQGQV